MGEDAPLAVGDDIIRDARQAEGGEDGIVPHALVADVTPRDGVAIHQTAALLGIGIETDADDAQAADALLLLPALQLALDVLALVVPRRPGGDDIDRGIEVAVGDGMTLDVDGGELGQHGTVADGLEPFEVADEGGDALVAGPHLEDGLCQGEGLLVVGRWRLDEVFVEEEGAGEGVGVLRDEVGGFLDGFRRRHLTDLQAEARQQFVLLGAAHLDLLQVGGIALDLYLCTGGADDGDLGVVGEDEDEGGGGVEGDLVGEPSALHTDGVDLADAAVRTIDIEFALVETLELALHAEGAAVGAAGGEKEDGRCKKEEKRGEW